MKYIMITIYDNDFWFPLETISNYIRETYMWFDSNSFTEEGIPLLKEAVRDMLVSMEKVKYTMRWFGEESKHRTFDEEHYKRYFEPDIEIVDESEIIDEDDGNGEHYYIPLTHDTDAEIIHV